MAAPLRRICPSRKLNILWKTVENNCIGNRTRNHYSCLNKRRLFSEFVNSNRTTNSGLIWKVTGVCIASVSSVFAYNVCTKSLSAKSLHPVSRSVEGVLELSNVKFTLYQFQSCPYCCKVRATLDYYGFPYDVVEVNSLTKAQLKFSDYKKVPVLVVDGTNFKDEYQLKFCDSSLIVSVLASFAYDQTQTLRALHSYYPGHQEKKGRKTVWEFPNKYFVMYAENIADSRAEKDRKEERKWRRWTDEIFMHTISPNVYRTMKESFEAFKHFSDWGEWEKNFSGLTVFCLVNLGAVAMYLVGGIVKRRHNIKNDPRESLYEACDEWMNNLGKRSFVGGDKPNLADLSMYGAMNSFNNCTAFNELMETHKIKGWFTRMEEQVNKHKGSEMFEKAMS